MVQVQRIVELIQADCSWENMAEQLSASSTDLKKVITDALKHTYKDEVPLPQLVSTRTYANTGNTEFDEIIDSSPIKFSDEQIDFMRMAVIDRKNIALLAAAGYGKSAALNTTMKLFSKCVEQDTPDMFNQLLNTHSGNLLATMPVAQICATTGRAALLLGARTIHSLLGIGLARGTPEQWYKRLSTAKFMQNTHMLLMAMQCLVIDEISMLGGKLLDKISTYLKMIKHCDKPFGGVQMIFIGDFAQLPPINDTFAFQSKEYASAEVETIQFTKCFRQSDPTFKELLDRLRFAKPLKQDIDTLRRCTSIEEEYLGGLRPTLLRSTNREVDEINERELAALCEETGQTPVALRVNSKLPSKRTESLCKTYMIPESVQIAIGAQVMVTFNVSRFVVNGTLGIVKEIKENAVVITLPNGINTEISYVGFKNPDAEDVYTEIDMFTYMPLRVAYAISIHKSQGMTIPLLEVDAGSIFVSGQLYVAISRATDMKGLIVKNLRARAIMCDKRVRGFYGVE